jgi:hypothetical protein
MNPSMTIALTLVMALSGSYAYAQTEQPNARYHTHHYAPHHAVHRHTAPAPVATAPAPQAGPFGLALPHIAPYPDNQGDEDGLSLDPDDCMKGCIGGNPQ